MPVKTKAKKTRAKGRPSSFTKKLGDKICAEIAEGKSLRTVCASPSMPAKATVFRWLRLPDYQDFRDQYARACEDRANAFAEELLDIADDATNDYMEVIDKDGIVVGYKVNGEAILRSKLRSDNRKWLMAKMLPKKYGEKLDLTNSDRTLKPVAIFDMRSGRPMELKPVADQPAAKPAQPKKKSTTIKKSLKVVDKKPAAKPKAK